MSVSNTEEVDTPVVAPTSPPLPAASEAALFPPPPPATTTLAQVLPSVNTDNVNNVSDLSPAIDEDDDDDEDNDVINDEKPVGPPERFDAREQLALATRLLAKIEKRLRRE